MIKKSIIATSKITYKYQITIPKEVRNKCELEYGDTIVFVCEGDKVYIVNGDLVLK